MRLTHLLLALLIGSPALAQLPTGDLVKTRATLQSWFQGYEFVPTEAHYKALGPSLGLALIAMAFDDAAHPIERARAVSSMVHAVTPQTEAALIRLVETEQIPSLLKRKAVLTLAHGWRAKHQALVVSLFSLSRADIRLREACARALRVMGPEAYAARDALMNQAKAPTVRGLLQMTKRVGATD